MTTKPEQVMVASLKGGCFGNGARIVGFHKVTFRPDKQDMGLGFRFARVCSPIQRLAGVRSVK